MAYENFIPYCARSNFDDLWGRLDSVTSKRERPHANILSAGLEPLIQQKANG